MVLGGVCLLFLLHVVDDRFKIASFALCVDAKIVGVPMQFCKWMRAICLLLQLMGFILGSRAWDELVSVQLQVIHVSVELVTVLLRSVRCHNIRLAILGFHTRGLSFALLFATNRTEFSRLHPFVNLVVIRVIVADDCNRRLLIICFDLVKFGP